MGEQLLALGVVGVNLEDAGRTSTAHQAVLAAVRAANDKVFLNARSDEFWSGGRNLRVALERCRAYRDAGAHGVFVPGLTNPRSIETVAGLGLPVNVLWQPTLDLRTTSAARVSTGSALYRTALHAAISAAQAARTGHQPGPTISYATTQRLLAPTPPASNP